MYLLLRLSTTISSFRYHIAWCWLVERRNINSRYTTQKTKLSTLYAELPFSWWSGFIHRLKACYQQQNANLYDVCVCGLKFIVFALDRAINPLRLYYIPLPPERVCACVSISWQLSIGKSHIQDEQGFLLYENVVVRNFDFVTVVI